MGLGPPLPVVCSLVRWRRRRRRRRRQGGGDRDGRGDSGQLVGRGCAAIVCVPACFWGGRGGEACTGRTPRCTLNDCDWRAHTHANPQRARAGQLVVPPRDHPRRRADSFHLGHPLPLVGPPESAPAVAGADSARLADPHIVSSDRGPRPGQPPGRQCGHVEVGCRVTPGHFMWRNRDWVTGATRCRQQSI